MRLNFECFCGRSTALRSFRENWRQAIYRCWFSSRSGLKALFFLIDGQQQKPLPTKTCPVDFCPVANAYTISGHQLFVSASLLHFIRPVFFERFVEFHRASGFTCSEELWRERSSVASFTAALPCFSSPLHPPNEKFSACFRIFFQQYISPHSFLDSSLARKPKCNERNHQRVLCRTRGSWSPNCLVSKSFSC